MPGLEDVFAARATPQQSAPTQTPGATVTQGGGSLASVFASRAGQVDSASEPAPEEHSGLGIAAHGVGEAVSASPVGQAVSMLQGVPHAVMHPIDTVTGLAKDAWDASMQSTSQIKTDWQHGDLSGVLNDFIGATPIIGPMLRESGDRLGEAFAGKLDETTGQFHVDPYEIAGAAGHAAGTALTLAMSAHPRESAEAVKNGTAFTAAKTLSTAKKTTEAAIDLTSRKTPPEKMMMSALRGSAPAGRVDFSDNLRNSTMPAILEASQATKTPINGIDSLIKTGGKPGLIDVAKRNIQGKIDAIEGPRKAMGQVISGESLAESIRDTITGKMIRENPGEVSKLRRVANAYGKSNLSIDEAYKLLGDTNDTLNTYYAKNPVAKRIAAGSNPEIAHQVALANELRNKLYAWEQDPSVGDDVRALRKQQGHLIELEDSLYRRRNVAMRAAPENLSSQMSKWSSMGNIAMGAVKTLSGNTEGVAQVAKGAAQFTTAKWLQDYISTDSLINRAFAKDVKANPNAGIQAKGFTPKALLERGPVRMGGVADASGATTFMHPPEWSQPPSQRLLGPARGNPVTLSNGEPLITPAPDGSVPRNGPQHQGMPVGSGVNRLLGSGSQIQQPGFDVIDAVPVKNPKTGKYEYVPQHWKDAAKGHLKGR